MTGDNCCLILFLLDKLNTANTGLPLLWTLFWMRNYKHGIRKKRYFNRQKMSKNTLGVWPNIRAWYIFVSTNEIKNSISEIFLNKSYVYFVDSLWIGNSNFTIDFNNLCSSELPSKLSHCNVFYGKVQIFSFYIPYLSIREALGVLQSN